MGKCMCGNDLGTKYDGFCLNLVGDWGRGKISKHFQLNRREKTSIHLTYSR
jgi:hypothetical protein